MLHTQILNLNYQEMKASNDIHIRADTILQIVSGRNDL